MVEAITLALILLLLINTLETHTEKRSSLIEVRFFYVIYSAQLLNSKTIVSLLCVYLHKRLKRSFKYNEEILQDTCLYKTLLRLCRIKCIF